MAKSVDDAVLDGALNIIKNGSTRMVLCSAQPTTYTEGNATYALADVTVAPADLVVSGTAGRTLTVAAKAGVTVDAGGTGNHICLLNVASTRLDYVTTTTATAVAAAGTVDIGSWTITLADPT